MQKFHQNFDKNLMKFSCMYVCSYIHSLIKMLSFWWNFHHWLHWKLSKRQLPSQPLIKIPPKCGLITTQPVRDANFIKMRTSPFQWPFHGNPLISLHLSSAITSRMFCTKINNRPLTHSIAAAMNPLVVTNWASNHILIQRIYLDSTRTWVSLASVLFK